MAERTEVDLFHGAKITLKLRKRQYITNVCTVVLIYFIIVIFKLDV